MSPDLDIAKNYLIDKDQTLVIVKNGNVLFKSNETGVKVLVEIFKSQPNILEKASVADTITGRAAAIIYSHGNIKELYTNLISKNAEEVLDKKSISYIYKNKVDNIMNRTKTDLCPIEKIAKKSSTIDELIYKIEDF
ncbi:hypothetical protein ING2D1G_1595 [Peptoniphilus sp. ING2-D1G]|nr:hypothetical protein ING2D1G_1595 [Peptoniphilus sp. ING2-D1G]